MKKSKILSAVLSIGLAASLALTGCQSAAPSTASSSSSGAASAANSLKGKKTTIEFLNSKSEIAHQMEALAKDFNDANKDGITVNVTTLTNGTNASTTLMTRYAAHNAPALAMVDQNTEKTFPDKIADLSNEKWVNDISPMFKVADTFDGKVKSFPFCVEGWGLIYNKTAIEKATKEKFDPSAIKTRADLEALFAKIKTGGTAATELTKEAWSLGGHIYMLATIGQSQNSADVTKYADKLKDKQVDYNTDKVFNSLIDSLDLCMKYNIYKDAPLSADYASTDPKNLMDGKAATWYNGTWVWANLKQLGAKDTDEYGFLPFFIGNSADDYRNKSIAGGVTKTIMLDKEDNSEDQQAAAKELLNWMAYDNKGQSDYVTGMDVVPALKNITLKPSDPLSLSLMSYVQKGNMIVSNYASSYAAPPSLFSEIGGDMQKYLAGKTDRKGLATTLNTAWSNADIS